MAFLFGGARTVSRSPLRDQQTELNKGIRALTREDARAGTEERRLTQEIQRNAAKGSVETCVTRAKELVRVRAHRGRLASMRGHMTGLAQQLSTFQGTQRLTETLAKTALAMRSLNRQFDPRSVQRMLAEYERQSALMATTQEIVTEGLDSALELEEEREATDDAVASVFRDLGLAGLAASVTTRGEGLKQLDNTQEEANLEQRLARLRHVA